VHGKVPRSAWLCASCSPADFAKVARAADWSDAATAAAAPRRCKLLVEQDRAAWAREQGYDAALLRLTGEEGYAKDGCIVAAPAADGLRALLAAL
jgi:hypothetical protein